MPGNSSAYSPSLLFHQVQKIINLGKKRPLEAADLPELPLAIDPRNESHPFSDLTLGSSWGFIRSVMGKVRGSIIQMAVVIGICGLLSLSSPFVIHALIEAAAQGKNTGHTLLEGGVLAALLCLLNVGEALFYQHYVYRALTTNQKIVNGLNERIYRHALVLTRHARQKSGTGEIVNYMGTDTDTVAESVWIWVELCNGLLTMILGTVALFYYLGSAALCALIVILLMLPLTRAMGKRLTRLDDQVMDYRDQRVSQMSQILSGIRIVKYFAWVPRVEADILKVRSRELKERTRLAKTRAISVMLYVSASVIVSVATFSVYLGLGHTLDAATVFTALAIFGILEGPLGNLGGFVAELAAAKVSADRIRLFLQEESQPTSTGPMAAAGSPIGCSLEDVSVCYGDANGPILKKINLTIQSGSSLAIVGPVGAGKTSLLLAILGEAPVTQGKIAIGQNGQTESPRWAYVPQEAFVMNSSLIENVAFGAQADRSTCLEAIRLCGLEHDVQCLPNGIDTEIGEQGINLSGGQKQRLGLARAFVAGPGMVLLDDPFAAVDEHTEDFLVDHLLMGAWRGITRIVVTHRLKHLKQFDTVVFVQNGQITSSGQYDELIDHDPQFAAFIAATANKDHGVSMPKLSPTSAYGDKAPIRQNGRITDEEDRERGSVQSQFYLDYIRTMTGRTGWEKVWMFTSLGLSVLLVACLPIAQSSWLAVWTSMIGKKAESIDQVKGLFIYGLLGFGLIIAALAQNLWWALRGINAGQRLHDEALAAVLRAKVRFFDATPVGRILNRFSRDIDSIERSLPNALEATVRCLVNLVGATVLLVVLLPAILGVVFPVFFYFLKLQGDYRASAREAQRISSVARSPRFSHFKETLAGLTVIRAFHQEAHFLSMHRQVLASYQKAFHGMVLINRWFSTRVPLATAFISFGATLGILVSSRFGLVTIGSVGLTLTYATRFWGNLNWAIRSFSDLESRMTAVERVRTYQKIPPEVDVTQGPPLPEEVPWPTGGQVRFENVTVSYDSHLPDVLRDVTLHIKEGSRVGLIGRTGSGKSTILQVLYRFIEPRLGTVLIDHIDIRKVPLSRLRRSLAIIPQDPTLFRGTIRENLDRFEECSDEEIWSALEQVYLKDFVASMVQGIRATVVENGNNFSQGQRQLLCLARALLLNAKIIVMDEATASVDVETDALIQKAIQRAFHGRTMIIIAHRLATIADCDQIIALENGSARNVTFDQSLTFADLSAPQGEDVISHSVFEV